MGNYEIKNIYQGGSSLFNPSYGSVFTGYQVSAGGISLSTDARTANIVQEVSSKISSGAKSIELNQVFPEVFDAIPKQHLKELNRLTKLTGVDITMHAPIIEASGVTKEGYSEENRRAAERQAINAIEKAHEINPNGNFAVTFHSAVMLPGTIKEKGKEPHEIYVMNTEDNSIRKLPLKERFWKGEEKPKIETELNKINESIWKDNLNTLAYRTQMGSRSFEGSAHLATSTLSEKKPWDELTEQAKDARTEFNYAITAINNSYRELKNLFEIASKQGREEDKEKLKEFVKKIEDKIDSINKRPEAIENIGIKRQIVEEGLELLNHIQTPEIYRPLQTWAMDKSATTFGNAAFESYKKYKDKSPIISIENPPVGSAEFSTGEELKKLAESSREQFVKKAQEELGMSKSEAEKQAEKIIGITWDVGHINMLRKYGYTDKELIKETEKVAPLVKHVHLSDNFGFEHSELPMGMGNVPIKEIMQKLGEEGFKGKKVVEALQWWQHFKSPPLKETLEAFGSPFYVESGGPNWSRATALDQGYFSGYGGMLPSGNYEMFGAGFSTLPAELGGVRRGAEGSRMSGRGME